MPIVARANDGSLLIAVKAVPGASRDGISGVLGERLKVRVSAAPEGGKANKAIEAVIARALGVKPRDVEVVQGHASAEKTVRVGGSAPADAEMRLGIG